MFMPMSTRKSVFMSISFSTSISLYLSTCLPICIAISLSLSQSLDLSVAICINLSIYLPTYLPTYSSYKYTHARARTALLTSLDSASKASRIAAHFCASERLHRQARLSACSSAPALSKIDGGKPEMHCKDLKELVCNPLKLVPEDAPVVYQAKLPSSSQPRTAVM